MDLANYIYRMVKSTKETFSKAISMDRAYILGKMEIIIRDNSPTIKDLVLVSIIGVTEVFIKENGKTTE
jgi:hypothetical protein